MINLDYLAKMIQGPDLDGLEAVENSMQTWIERVKESEKKPFDQEQCLHPSSGILEDWLLTIKCLIQTEKDKIRKEEILAELRPSLIEQQDQEREALYESSGIFAPGKLEDFDPRGFYVYLLLDETDTIIYIGQSVNVLGRLGSHSVQKRGLFTKVQLIQCSNRNHMNGLETYLIKKHRPALNRTGNPDFERRTDCA